MKAIWRTTYAGACAGFLALLSLLGAGALAARAAPEIRYGVIVLNDWPSAAAPVRVALLSDIHLGPGSMSARRLDELVERVNSAHPDLVLLAGDYVTGHGVPSEPDRSVGLAAPLSKLRARLGVVAVLGNHDYWTDPAAVRRALATAEVAVLENTAVARGPVVIVGVADAFSRHDRLGEALASARALKGPRVILTHSPDLATKSPPDAPVLAGHTHCGQIALPLVGSLAGRSPREGWKPLYDPRYRCGLIREPGRTIVVTAGVGAGSLPLRIGARPDWWMLTIGPPPASAAGASSL
jgi:predicted MPP superfamily phosphohydrolase